MNSVFMLAVFGMAQADIQAEFDAIRECSIQYTCLDDFVPDECLPRRRFLYRSTRCTISKDQCLKGEACSRRSLKMKMSDFRQILGEFGLAPLANKSSDKKRHNFYHPAVEEAVDLGVCLGSCARHKR